MILNHIDGIGDVLNKVPYRSAAFASQDFLGPCLPIDLKLQISRPQSLGPRHSEVGLCCEKCACLLSLHSST